MSYTLSFESANAKLTDVIMQLQPEFDTYFKQNGRQLQQWLAGLDHAAQPQQSNRLGKTVLQFKTLTSGDVLNAWSSPVDLITYQKLSMEIQKRLKALLPYYYFQDPDQNRHRFVAVASAIPALVYAALPPMPEFDRFATGDPAPNSGTRAPHSEDP
jgi:hypothetical protein